MYVNVHHDDGQRNEGIKTPTIDDRYFISIYWLYWLKSKYILASRKNNFKSMIFVLLLHEALMKILMIKFVVKYVVFVAIESSPKYNLNCYVSSIVL